MRQHTKEFKNEIQKNGRQLDSKIIIKGSELVLGSEDLFSVTPVTNSTLLKSVMKEVDFESKKQIGIGQEVNIKSGVKVNGEYEYIDYGNYSVYKSEYKAETDTYSHICYDKMLKTMIDYTPLDITYPINLREYINAIATKCGLEFAGKNSTFANYNTSINEDHFSNGNYTFRDVLDYIAQLVGGWLCINDNDELEIRYPELAKYYGEANGKNVSFTSNVEDEINTIVVDGKSTQATSTNPVMPSPEYPSEIECVKGKNLFDINTASLNSALKWANGSYYTENLSVASDFIKIEKGKSYISKYKMQIILFNENKEYIGYYNNATNVYKYFTILTDSDCSYVKVSFRSSSNNNVDFTTIGDIQLEEGTVATDYLPYNTIQVKDVGKNLFDISKVITNWNTSINSGIRNNNDGTLTISNPPTSTTSIALSPNTLKDYCPNLQVGDVVYLNATTTGTNKYIYLDVSASLWTFGTKRTITQNDLDSKVYWYASGVNTTATISDIMISTDGGEYEPYQENTLNIDLQGNELCSLPNNVKDELVIENGRAKIIKNVGRYNITGNESWALSGTESQPYINFSNYVDNCKYPATTTELPNLLSNYYLQITRNNLYDGRITLSPGKALIIYDTVHNTSLANFKEWLKSAGVVVYYQLATPTEIDLGEVTTLSTFKGINNVSLVANMQTNMSLTYTTEFEELDKHFLKDVNVSFSKKYGAVNSVVFSRGNGSDNIYRKDNMSISRNGLTEIKITGNPFLEGNDRENFIQQLFDKINGLEFYIMDVASTGIMYLELGDLYYFNMVEEKPSLKSGLVKSGMRQAQGSSGGKFLCLLMNDEVKITQGLEESIYSDEPEITETDYKTASITDTSIKNAIIQTNKNSAEILLKVNSDEVVSAINLSPEKIKISSSKLDIDAIATFTNSKLAEAGSTVINGANITTGSINCDRLNGGTINGQKISGSTISGGSISITKGVYYFNMGTATSNPNCSGLNVGGYGIKAYSDITATGFAITDSDTGKSYSIGIYDGHGKVHYLTFTGGIITKWEYK